MIHEPFLPVLTYVLHIPLPWTFSNLQAAQRPVVIFEYFPERDYYFSAVKNTPTAT